MKQLQTSTDEMVPCPRGCGWHEGDPVTDSDGNPYTCFFCYNEGVVPLAAAEEHIQEVEAYSRVDSPIAVYSKRKISE